MVTQFIRNMGCFLMLKRDFPVRVHKLTQSSMVATRRSGRLLTFQCGTWASYWNTQAPRNVSLTT